MNEDSRYHELMMRFAPIRRRIISVDATASHIEPKAAVVVQRRCASAVFPIEVWAKILQWLPHVSRLIPISMVNKTLRAAIWY
jgi:hypothetical protein